MDTGAQRPDAQGTLTPLAQLSPALSNVTNRRVHAVITLIWPYSSARRSLDLLLSEPDYRLRVGNGLVKVRFHDESAAELSRLKASIGDHVVLHLEGAQWERQAAKVGILETSIDWELSFRDRLHLELQRNSNTVGTIDISPNLEEPENTPSTPIATPARRVADEQTGPTSDWASPAFTKRLAEFITRRAVPSSPLQEEDGYIPGRGRKRPKFGRPTGEWTFIPEPASPVASQDEIDDALNLDKLEEMLIAEDTQRREEEEKAARIREEEEEEEKAAKAHTEEEERAAKAREEAGHVSQAQEAPPVSSPTIQAQSTPALPDQAITFQPALPPTVDGADEMEVDEPSRVRETPLPIGPESSISHGVSLLEEAFRDSPRSLFLASFSSSTADIPTSELLAVTAQLSQDYPAPTAGGPPAEVQAPPIAPPDASVAASTAINEAAQITQGHEERPVDAEYSNLQVLSEAARQREAVPAAPAATDTHEKVGERISGEDAVERPAGQTSSTQPQGGLSAETIVDLSSDSEDYEDYYDRKTSESEEEEEDKEEEGEEEEEESEDDDLDYVEYRTPPRLLPKPKLPGTDDERDEEEGEEKESETGEDDSEVERRKEEEREVEEELAQSDSEDYEDYYDEEPVENVGEEEDEDESEEEEEDEDEEEEGEEDYKEYEQGWFHRSATFAPQRPTQPSGPPEVIVLDSDSEEEEPPAPEPARPPQLEARESHPPESPEPDEELSAAEADADTDMADEEAYAEKAAFARVTDAPGADVEQAQQEAFPAIDPALTAVAAEATDVADEERYVREAAPVRDTEVPEFDVEETKREGLPEAVPQVEAKATDVADEETYVKEAASAQDTQVPVFDVEETKGGVVGLREVPWEYVGEGREQPAADVEIADEEAYAKKAASTRDMEVPEIDVEETVGKDVVLPEEAKGDVDQGHTQEVAEAPAPPVEEKAPSTRGGEVGGESKPAETAPAVVYPTEVIDVEDANNSEVKLVEKTMPDVPTYRVARGPEEVEMPVPLVEEVNEKGGEKVEDAVEHIVPEGESEEAKPRPEDTKGEFERDIREPTETEARQRQGNAALDMEVQPKDEKAELQNVRNDPYASPSIIDNPFNISRSPSPTFQLNQELELFSRLEDMMHEDFEDGADFDETGGNEDMDVSQVESTEDISMLELPGPQTQVEGFRSKYAYYSPLATLAHSFGSTIDTMAVVLHSTDIEKAGKGPRDHYVTLEVTEPSMSGISVPVQCFRHSKESLPVATPGDVILLRTFKVRTMDHTLVLTSCDSSAWAVFKQGGGEYESETAHVQLNGPPVEYGEEELAHAAQLRDWFATEGQALSNKQEERLRALRRFATPVDGADEASAVSSVHGAASMSASGSVVGSGDSGSPAVRAQLFKRYSRKTRRITFHKLRFGRQYTEVGSPPAKEILHELRDGTTWSDL